MSLKSWIFYQYSKWIVFKEQSYSKNASSIQNQFLLKIIRENKNSKFGLDHDFYVIKNYADYIAKVPLRTYEDFIPYINQVKNGNKNILTKKEPLYFLMTSGTTAGTKFIPISKSGIINQINAAKKLLCFYSVNTKQAKFVDHKMIFLQGSPELTHEFSIPCARLSGVIYHHIPKFFQRNRLPKYETNIISNWEEKVDQIVLETKDEDISVLGGIPPWCIQYFEKLLTSTGKQNLKDLFPNLSLYIYGGLDFSSYRSSMEKILGENVHCLQTFPASEGFFGIQDRLDVDEMLLLVNQGIFYEFLDTQGEVLRLDQVEVLTSYELIITNDSGLWRYKMGDLIQFTSLNPYRIKVVGRTSQFISAFGEHVIGYEVEKTMDFAIEKFNLNITDYYLSANIESRCYEWRIEWKSNPLVHILELSDFLDNELAKLNPFYAHLINGKIINSSKIISLKSNSFSHIRKEMNKDGGQNKVLRLGSDKVLINKLNNFKEN